MYKRLSSSLFFALFYGEKISLLKKKKICETSHFFSIFFKVSNYLFWNDNNVKEKIKNEKNDKDKKQQLAGGNFRNVCIIKSKDMQKCHMCKGNSYLIIFRYHI